MNAILNSINGMLRNHTSRFALGAILAASGAASTASAHDDVRVDVDPLHGHIEIDRHHWDHRVIQDRQDRVWIEPVYNTVPGPRVWVEPVYRTVVDHVWHEAVTQDATVQILVPATCEERDIVHGNHVHRERILIPAHYETRVQQTVITPGYFEDVARQELVSEGHWQCDDQQVLVTPGHWEIRVKRVVR